MNKRLQKIKEVYIWVVLITYPFVVAFYLWGIYWCVYMACALTLMFTHSWGGYD